MEFKITKTPLILLFLITTSLYAQRDEVNPNYIRTQIGISLKENERQIKIKNHTSGAVVLEEQNKNQNKRWKETYEEMLKRLSWIEFGLSTIPAVYRMNEYIAQTRRGIEIIYQTIEDDPTLLIDIPTLESIGVLIQEIEMNLRLLTGVVISGADVFQMEIADRKKLISYVVEEFRYLSIQTWHVRIALNANRHRKRFKRNPLIDYINKDKRKFENVIRGIIS